MKWTPRPYQLDLVRFILTAPASACWARIGSGKTSATLKALEIMKEKAGWKTLVVAPKQVARDVWKQEAEKWGFDLKVVVLHGDHKNKLVKEDADVYVVNYDGLAWLSKYLPRGFAFDVMILDESSKCRNTDTNRFKLLRDDFRPKAKKVVELSGTPKPNGEINLYGQYRLLDHGKRLGKYITHFRMSYCYQTGFGGHTWELLPGAGELIRQKVQDITIVVDGDDVDGLPELVVRDLEVSMPPSAVAHYRDLETSFFTALRDTEVTAINAAAKIAKLRQVVSGAVYVDDSCGVLDEQRPVAHRPQHRWTEIHDARIEALDAFLEGASGPVLLFANFNHEFERIQKAFPEAVVFSWLSDKMRSEAIDEWNRGKIDLLCAHPASAGHGLNLQHGGHEMLWFSLLYDLELYEQAVGRLARTGQKNTHVHVTRFVTPGTVDDLMAAALASKARGQKKFLDDIKAHALKFLGRSVEKQVGARRCLSPTGSRPRGNGKGNPRRAPPTNRSNT